ncbi:MAG TPA: thioredoxin family protein [Cerasibacillus sp.]|uniref:thioredoxin family protein n=1 Tax=Cerasibacillus sp. TaxID=2498711 RepID=UPI002F41D6CE
MDTLKTKEQFNELINQGKVIFVFSADWCPDCRVIEPFYPEIIKAFPEYTFMMVDRDEFIDVCQAHDVFGIPSFIAFDNGKEIGRFVSKDRKTKEEIIQFIQGLSA